MERVYGFDDLRVAFCIMGKEQISYEGCASGWVREAAGVESVYLYGSFQNVWTYNPGTATPSA